MNANETLAALARSLTRPSPDQRPLLAGARNRWLRYLPYVLAVALNASLIPNGINVLTGTYGLNGFLAAALAVAQAAPLLAAVTRPLPAWWFVFGADVVAAVLTHPSHGSGVAWPWSPTAIIGYLALMAALALRESDRTLVAVWLLTGLTGLAPVLWPSKHADNSALLVFVLSGIVLLVGWAVRERATARSRLVEQEQISEAERGRRALLEERTRIARELHDVVAHHMSVITVQADSAPYRIPGLPEAAREEFTAIADAARQSLGEMRRLLGVLRSDESAAERSPQPGVGRLARLVEAVARAGVPAELTIAPDPLPGPLPDTVDLSAYRIVQEALANVVRHAPGARTWVSLALEDATLLVTVVNAPPPGRAASLEARADGTGHGLAGMRERVRLLDGRLDLGPLPDGGFRVAAALPVQHQHQQSEELPA